jgi:membrane-associated protease RseP (regulator of RpoE activity)
MILVLYAAAAFLAMLVMFAVYALVTAALMRRAGLLVQAVTVGYGPALWRREIRGTWYSLRWIPLGASVKCPWDEEDLAPEDDWAAEDDMPSEQESSPRSERVRLFGELPLREQLLILVSGHVVTFLIGVALLAVAVVAGTPQLAACDAAESMVQPCGMPGLRWEDAATSVTGQAVLFRESGIEFVHRMLLFRPLDEWGGILSMLVTAGVVGQESLVSWVTLIGLLWTMTGLVNFLPVPCLAGFQILQFTAEAWFGKQRLQFIVLLLMNIGLLYLVILNVRLLWLDVQWIRTQWL